jgi:hypothetical protein
MCPGRFMGQIALVLAAMTLGAKYTVKLPRLDEVGVSYRSLLLPEGLVGGWYETSPRTRDTWATLT